MWRVAQFDTLRLRLIKTTSNLRATVFAGLG